MNACRGYEFKNCAEAYETIFEYIKSYNKVWTHGSLGYISTMEFYHIVLEETAKPLIVKL